MSDQAARMKAFRALHISGDPLVLMNVWDAGSAKALADTHVPALATGSMSLAGALGYEDGEQCPRDLVLQTLALICRVTDKPVTHDAERGYGDTAAEVGDYVHAIVEAGAVGINLEDSVADGSLRDIDEQCARISAAKSALGDGYLNARTDVFFQDDSRSVSEKLDTVIQRAEAFRKAGADGLFVPRLTDFGAMKELCSRTDLPVNVMRQMDGPPIAEFAAAGVARISHGPFPWLQAMADLKNAVAL